MHACIMFIDRCLSITIINRYEFANDSPISPNVLILLCKWLFLCDLLTRGCNNVSTPSLWLSYFSRKRLKSHDSAINKSTLEQWICVSALITFTFRKCEITSLVLVGFVRQAGRQNTVFYICFRLKCFIWAR